jgi:hypothetical protein
VKRSFGKTAEITFWFVGSCGAILFSCWLVFAMFYTRKVNPGVLMMLAIGIFGAWEGFKMFRTERNNSNKAEAAAVRRQIVVRQTVEQAESWAWLATFLWPQEKLSVEEASRRLMFQPAQRNYQEWLIQRILQANPTLTREEVKKELEEHGFYQADEFFRMKFGNQRDY